MTDELERCVRDDRITVEWLHSIRPAHWQWSMRGIMFANWSVHSIRFRPANVPVDEWDGYNIGPFVWAVAPSHDKNMMTLKNPCRDAFAILVLQSRAEVLKLLDLIEPGRVNAKAALAQKTDEQ